MFSSKIKASISLLVLCGMVATFGCILNPKSDPEPPPPPPPWPDRTEPEHVVQILVRAYVERNFEKFNEILVDPEYLFFLQETDVQQGEEKFWTREEDYDATRNMFLAALGTPAEDDPELVTLELTIEGAEVWTAVDSIGDEPCEGCLETQRNYDIKAIAVYPTGETTYLGNDVVLFYVQPAMEGSVLKYKLKRMYDLDAL
jgi:hypothetical protein